MLSPTEIIIQTTKILREEPSILYLQTGKPLTILGDLHGHYDSLMKIMLSHNVEVLVVLGDIVDKGPNSVETLLYLCNRKLSDPHSTYFIRGNHECGNLNEKYGFYDEILDKVSDENFWPALLSFYNEMPIGAYTNFSLLVHGGLSPSILDEESLLAVSKPSGRIERFDGLACDLLWSDPSEIKNDFWKKSPRGLGYTFDSNISKYILHDLLKLKHLIRAHQIQPRGCRKLHDGLVYSVFSAINFCDNSKNNGGFIIEHPNGRLEMFSIDQSGNHQVLE